MAIKVKKGSVTKNTYDVSGETLADIWNSIKANGPKHKGSARAGKTVCSVNMDASSSKFDFTSTQGKKDWESEATMSQGELTYDCTIEMPKLKSDESLSDAAKKEWARFMKELLAHEDDHVTDFGKTAAAIGKDIENLTAKGKGATEAKAQKAAHAAYVKDYSSKFSKTENDKRLMAGSDALDSGGHGPTLDTSIK